MSAVVSRIAVGFIFYGLAENLGKTAKNGKITLEKRQKSTKIPWKNGMKLLILLENN
ncbi:MAG: hypothetical protein K2M54_08205 [Muribaculaceae bacterium]|nr:hypothetical protein [Muribaculaceae bacterium]MDE7458095.1 hypothetical protein [Muribaculaceae bacterium]